MMNDAATRPTSQAPGGYDPLPTVRAAYWLALFSFREMVRRKRIFALSLLNLIPVLVVLAVRIWYPGGSLTHQTLQGLSHEVYIQFLIPIVAIAMGVPAIGELVGDGTIVFPWTRPVRRRSIFLGRVLAAQIVTTFVMSISLVLCFLIMVSEGLHVVTFDFLKLYLETFLIIGLGAFTYTALFAAMGTFFKKPVLVAILYTLGWELLITKIPARIQELSLRYHLQNFIERPEATPNDVPSLLESFLTTMVKRDPVPEFQSFVVLVGVTIVAMVVGTWLLKHKEIEN